MKSFGLVLFLVLSVSHATNAQRGCSADDQVPVEEPVRLADFVALLSIDIPESCQEFTNPLQLVPCREELNVASGCCVTQCREVMALFDVQCLEDLTEVLCSSDTTSAAVPLLNGIAARCDDEYTTELTCGEPDTDSDDEEEEEEPDADSDDEDDGDDEDEVEEEELDISDAMFADESAVAPEMEDMDKGLEKVEEEEQDKRQRRVFGGSRGKDDDDDEDDDDDDDDEDDDDDDDKDDDDDETRTSTTVTSSTSVRGTGTGSASASSSASVTTPGGTRTRTSRSSSRSGSG